MTRPSRAELADDTDWRLHWALQEWLEAERFRAIAANTERLFRPSCYTLTWRAREIRARQRLRYAVLMNECGGRGGYAAPDTRDVVLDGEVGR
jgi:hypothetical protein